MRRRTGIYFILIVILTTLALLTNFAQEYKINFQTPKLPILNKQITIKQDFKGLNPNFNLGPVHFQRDLSFRKGLDLQGGTSITLKADMNGVPAAQRDNALESAKSVIERRVNFFGVSEPVVQTSKTGQEYRIITELPGVTDLNQAVNLRKPFSNL